MKMVAKFAWTGVLLAVFLMSCVNALFEDQIKKFDWRSLHIGALQHAHLELNSFQPRMLVSTRENVIASLCPKSGALLWRQVFESGLRGDIKLLQVSATSNIDASSSTAAARQNSNHGFDMFTVQGYAPALVRGWNANIGTIEWEWSLMPLHTERAQAALWLYADSILYHIVPVWKSHLEVTQYFATTGQAVGLTAEISAPWTSESNCVLSGVYYTCSDGKQLISIDVTASKPQVQIKQLETLPKNRIEVLKGTNGVLVIDKTLVSVTENISICNNLQSNSYIVGNFNLKRVIAQADVVNNLLQIKAYYADSCEQVPELSHALSYPAHFGTPALSTFDCKLKRNNDGKSCLFLLSTEDEAILAVQQSKLRWTREEALAKVVATEFIDLPLADTEGTLEKEMKGQAVDSTGFETDIATAFMRRISTQMLQIKSIFLHLIGLGPAPTDTQRAGLVRDSFGLHKMLVMLTKSGKIFGIDNINGKQHWQYYLENVENFANEESMRLIVQRTSKHFPLQPLCTIVAREKSTGNGVLFRFNPITGKPAEGGLLKLNYKIQQISLLAETETDSVKGILLIDANAKVNVYPETAEKMANGLFLFIADKVKATLNGFHVKYAAGQLTTTRTWNAKFGGIAGEHQIIAVAGKNPIEHVHSQGRVMADRSVLYKYINPNLVAVVTQAADSIHKYVINVHLVDAVSGFVVFSLTHRKVRGPLHIVHSENWLAYAYYNDKVRRTEITTMELYEGKKQANSTVWSSLNAPPLPLVERQSYILPAVVQTMRETITERGITSKHILIGTASGAIVEMPWALLDPRRPIASTTQGREEGAIPYIPELPLPTENFVNYNQTISRLSFIHTAPSGLESTCLVVAAGLDIFATRVAPSKTFDLLKEDFDYTLITMVLVGLTTASLVAKHLASRKLLKQAWK